MRYFILTWSPDSWNWEDYQKCIQRTLNNQIVDKKWSIGKRKYVDQGDRVFLFRLNNNRGILASGIITSDGIYSDTHYSDPSKKANYVDCRFENIVAPENVLVVEKLNELDTGVAWKNLQASGVEISQDDGPVIEKAWQTNLKNHGSKNFDTQNHFAQLLIGKQYDRKQLSALWGYEDFHAIGRGIFTPSNQNRIILFVTEKQQPSLTQYDNRFDGEFLWMDGEEGHRNDGRLADSLQSDEVHLFYRSQNRLPFTYYGQVFLVESEIKKDSPSRFLFSVSEELPKQVDWVIDDYNPENFDGEKEGLKKLRIHVTYERSKKNRDAAIEIHGTICKACGFDFNAFYGQDLARSYIEIHHTTSITELEGKKIDPRLDLVPLCSNCHRMAHRGKGSILTVEEIQEHIEKQKATLGD